MDTETSGSSEHGSNIYASIKNDRRNVKKTICFAFGIILFVKYHAVEQ